MSRRSKKKFPFIDRDEYLVYDMIGIQEYSDSTIIPERFAERRVDRPYLTPRCLYFTGSDYIVIPESSEWYLDNDDFVTDVDEYIVELWIKVTASQTGTDVFWGNISAYIVDGILKIAGNNGTDYTETDNSFDIRDTGWINVKFHLDLANDTYSIYTRYKNTNDWGLYKQLVFNTYTGGISSFFFDGIGARNINTSPIQHITGVYLKSVKLTINDTYKGCLVFEECEAGGSVTSLYSNSGEAFTITTGDITAVRAEQEDAPLLAESGDMVGWGYAKSIDMIQSLIDYFDGVSYDAYGMLRALPFIPVTTLSAGTRLYTTNNLGGFRIQHRAATAEGDTSQAHVVDGKEPGFYEDSNGIYCWVVSDFSENKSSSIEIESFAGDTVSNGQYTFYYKTNNPIRILVQSQVFENLTVGLYNDFDNVTDDPDGVLAAARDSSNRPTLQGVYDFYNNINANSTAKTTWNDLYLEYTNKTINQLYADTISPTRLDICSRLQFEQVITVDDTNRNIITSISDSGFVHNLDVSIANGQRSSGLLGVPLTPINLIRINTNPSDNTIANGGDGSSDTKLQFYFGNLRNQTQIPKDKDTNTDINGEALIYSGRKDQPLRVGGAAVNLDATATPDTEDCNKHIAYGTGVVATLGTIIAAYGEVADGTKIQASDLGIDGDKVFNNRSDGQDIKLARIDWSNGVQSVYLGGLDNDGNEIASDKMYDASQVDGETATIIYDTQDYHTSQKYYNHWAVYGASQNRAVNVTDDYTYFNFNSYATADAICSIRYSSPESVLNFTAYHSIVTGGTNPVGGAYGFLEGAYVDGSTVARVAPLQGFQNSRYIIYKDNTIHSSVKSLIQINGSYKAATIRLSGEIIEGGIKEIYNRDSSLYSSFKDAVTNILGQNLEADVLNNQMFTWIFDADDYSGLGYGFGGIEPEKYPETQLGWTGVTCADVRALLTSVLEDFDFWLSEMVTVVNNGYTTTTSYNWWLVKQSTNPIGINTVGEFNYILSTANFLADGSPSNHAYQSDYFRTYDREFDNYSNLVFYDYDNTDRVHIILDLPIIIDEQEIIAGLTDGSNTDSKLGEANQYPYGIHLNATQKKYVQLPTFKTLEYAYQSNEEYWKEDTDSNGNAVLDRHLVPLSLEHSDSGFPAFVYQTGDSWGFGTWIDDKTITQVLGSSNVPSDFTISSGSITAAADVSFAALVLNNGDKLVYTGGNSLLLQNTSGANHGTLTTADVTLNQGTQDVFDHFEDGFNEAVSFNGIDEFITTSTFTVFANDGEYIEFAFATYDNTIVTRPYLLSGNSPYTSNTLEFGNDTPYIRIQLGGSNTWGSNAIATSGFAVEDVAIFRITRVDSTTLNVYLKHKDGSEFDDDYVKTGGSDDFDARPFRFNNFFYYPATARYEYGSFIYFEHNGTRYTEDNLPITASNYTKFKVVSKRPYNGTDVFGNELTTKNIYVQKAKRHLN